MAYNGGFALGGPRALLCRAKLPLQRTTVGLHRSHLFAQLADLCNRLVTLIAHGGGRSVRASPQGCLLLLELLHFQLQRLHIVLRLVEGSTRQQHLGRLPLLPPPALEPREPSIAAAGALQLLLKLLDTSDERVDFSFAVPP